MERPQLYGTPLSHFTRKIRILLMELGVEFDFVRLPGVLATSASAFADNPLMRVPALRHGGELVFEADHIARYVVGRFDPADRFEVRSERVQDMNRLAAINGIMAHEVTLILTARSGFTDLDSVGYLRKLKVVVDEGLGWLDAQTDPEAPGFTYVDIAMVCMWEHLVHYQSAPELERWTRLGARAARLAARPSVAATAPVASLAEAAAAGWTPG